MRTSADDEKGGCGVAAFPWPGYLRSVRHTGTDDTGTNMKVEFTCSLPGGMTSDAWTGIRRSRHAGSPEPVNDQATHKKYSG